MTKKRHHYVPKAYLRAFCDATGKLRVYRKDRPDKPLHQSPDNTALQGYYYSQPLPEGGMDHERLEDFFSQIETRWPLILERIGAKRAVNEILPELVEFLTLQRVRVPAAREAAEAMYASAVLETFKTLDAAGRFPPKPPGLEELLKNVAVSVNPQQSIHAMVHMLKGVGQVMDRVGIGALHNKTDRPFLTSDNPVIWFDPSVPDAQLRPYTLEQPPSPVVLLFPISPRLMIYGHSSMREGFARQGFGHSELTDPKMVETMNRHLCRFAYEAVFAQSPGQEEIIRPCAEVSPVLETHVLPAPRGKMLFFEHAFGKRKRRPKWTDSKADEP